MAFQKGVSGNPKGRVPGSRNYLNPSLWLGMLYNDLEQMEPEKRLPVLKWATEQILSKVQVLPATPGDSVSNADDALSLLKKLEGREAPETPAEPPPEAPPAAPAADSTGLNGQNGDNGHTH